VLGNLAAWTHGACVVYPSATFDAPRIVDAVAAERCTALHGVPTHFLGVLAELARRRAAGDAVDTRSLRSVRPVLVPVTRNPRRRSDADSLVPTQDGHRRGLQRADRAHAHAHPRAQPHRAHDRLRDECVPAFLSFPPAIDTPADERARRDGSSSPFFSSRDQVRLPAIPLFCSFPDAHGAPSPVSFQTTRADPLEKRVETVGKVRAAPRPRSVAPFALTSTAPL
jgi:hypothetical protein